MAKNKNFIFTIKDVRCFAGEQNLDIRPLTFLTGENSTGKTTIMGCFSTMHDLIGYPYRRYPPFNRDPYSFGGFKEIVRKAKDNKDQKTTFDIGIESDDPSFKFLFSFKENKEDSSPGIDCINIRFEDFEIFFDTVSTSPILSLKYKTESFKIPLSKQTFHPVNEIWHFWPFGFFHFITEAMDKEGKKKKKDSKKWIKFKTIAKKYEKKIMRYMRDHFSEFIISLAPIRSKPKRTYDPVGEELRVVSPEGSEVPLFLMRLSGQKKEDWKDLQTKLTRFGKASGLFSDIEVKKYGESMGEPFQLQFQVKGAQSNIMDIGYGVSQILPLLVHLFRSPSSRRFLLQQPEVHLHPKAQAELTSLLIQSVKQNQSFLIETHSDFMIDRTRIEIQKGNIPPDQVSLIYLESLKTGGVKAHNISFDKKGDILKTPKGYRDFFLKETDQFLGFQD